MRGYQFIRFIFWFCFIMAWYDVLFDKGIKALYEVGITIALLIFSYWWDLKRWYKRRRQHQKF